MRTLRLLIIVAALALAAAGPSQQPPRDAKGAVETKTQAAKEQQQPAPAPPLKQPEAKPQASQPPPAQSAPEHEGEAPLWTDQVVAITAVLVALFTGVLTFVGVQQWLLLRRSIRDSAEAIEIARNSADAASAGAESTRQLANAAGTAANAARRANIIARETSRDQLRAYVHLEAAHVLWRKAGVEIGLFVMNSGQTPATFFAIGAKASIVERRAAREPVTRDLKYKGWPAVGAHSQITALFRPAGAVGVKEGDLRADHSLPAGGGPSHLWRHLRRDARKRVRPDVAQGAGRKDESDERGGARLSALHRGDNLGQQPRGWRGGGAAI